MAKMTSKGGYEKSGADKKADRGMREGSKADMRADAKAMGKGGKGGKKC